MASRYYARARPRSETTLRTESLLARYPDLSAQEVAELIELFPSLPILDRGLMTADETLSRNLAAFERDHGSKLRGAGAPLLWFFAFPVILVIGVAWWLLA